MVTSPAGSWSSSSAARLTVWSWPVLSINMAENVMMLRLSPRYWGEASTCGQASSLRILHGYAVWLCGAAVIARDPCGQLLPALRGGDADEARKCRHIRERQY